MRPKTTALLATLSALPACGAFELISDGLSTLTRENADRPSFAYALRKPDDTNVYLATLTADRKGLPRGRVRTSLAVADIESKAFSPNGTHLSVGYVEYVGAELDIGVMVIDTERRRVTGFHSDNSVMGHVETQCSTALEGEAQQRLDLLGAEIDRTLTLTGMDYVDGIGEGILAPAFWASDTQLVTVYQLPYVLLWRDTQTGETGALPFGPPLNDTFGGRIDLVPDTNGRWQFQGCATTATPGPDLIETAQLRASPAGELLLDGTELEHILSPGKPLENRAVSRVTKWSFPF